MVQNVNEFRDMPPILHRSNITSGHMTQTWKAIILNSGSRARDLNDLETQGPGKMLYVYYLNDLSFMPFILLPLRDQLISHPAKSHRKRRARHGFTTLLHSPCSVV